MRRMFMNDYVVTYFQSLCFIEYDKKKKKRKEDSSIDFEKM